MDAYMVLDAVANFVRGTTDAAVDSSQTTVSVVDASIFPDPATEGEYNVVIWDAANFPRPDQDGDVEILRVTAIDTGVDELTVTRAQETTAAAAHPSGSAVHLSPTAKMFSDIETEYTASGENFDGEGTSDFTNLQSVNTGDVFTKSRSYDYIIKEESDGTVVVNGPDAQVASGAAATVIKSAVETNPSASYWVAGDVTVDSDIFIDLDGGNGLTFHMGGWFKPTSNINDYVIQFVNGRLIDVKMMAQGGGKYTNGDDYARNVSGLEAFLRIRGVRGADIEARYDSYGGRGVEIEAEASGEPKTSQIGINSLRGSVEQSAYVNTTNAFGYVDGVFVEETDGAVFDSTGDITLSGYENIMDGSNSFKLLSCDSVHVGTVAVGGLASPLVEITDCGRVDGGEIYCFGGEAVDVDGAIITGLRNSDFRIRTVLCQNNVGVSITDATNSKIRHTSDRDTRAARLFVSGTNGLDSLEYEVRAKDSEQRAVLVTDGGGGDAEYLRLRGDILNPVTGGGSFSAIEINQAGHTIDMEQMKVEAGGGDYHIDVPSGNDARAFGMTRTGSPGSGEISNALSLDSNPRT